MAEACDIETPSLEDLSEEDLIAQAKGELPYKLDAYREILRRHEGLVFSTCMKMIGNIQDAEEVCQDTFLQVFHKLHQFEGRSTFKTWLFRIVYNYCLGKRGALAKRRERDEAVGEKITQEAKDDRDAGMIPGAGELVHEVMQGMDDDERNLLVMRFVSGLSLAEIAEVLDLKLSAAKMRLYRTLETFKGEYTKLLAQQETEKGGLT